MSIIFKNKWIIFRGMSFIGHKLYTRTPNTIRAHDKRPLVTDIGKIIGMYCENHTEHIKIFCGKIQGFLW
jgi:hypothetical protein